MTAPAIAVVGTDTGAGKTVVSAGLAAALRRRGLAVATVKPVATGVAPGTAGDDATLLALATGARPEDCLLTGFALPRSPLAAAAAEGRTVDVTALARDIAARARSEDLDLLIVEGVGGLLVPLDDRHTVRDLLRLLGMPVLVVGRAGLGTINHCALTIEACRDAGLHVAGAVLVDVVGDGEDDLHRENAAQIAVQCGVTVHGVLPHLDGGAADVAALADACAAHLDLDGVVGAARGSPSPADDLVRLDRDHVWHPFTQTSEWIDEEAVVVREARGCWLVDVAGRRYLDGVASLWANVHGHAHPRLDAALRAQLGRVAHATFLGQTHEPGIRLAAELCAVAPQGLTRVFYSEAGAAAVEVALRVALLAQSRLGHPGRTRFLSLVESYHGDTAGAVSVGRSDPFHRGLDPLLFDAVRTPPPQALRRDGISAAEAEARSLTMLARTLTAHGHTLAALLIEPRIQGAAGMWPHSDAWLRDAAALAREHGLLVVCDEVATGFGRTGDLFASAGAGLAPDILVLGKGLTGGYLPLSATLVGDRLFDLFTGPYPEHRTLYYGHTYTANPLACAVARASLALFEEEDTLGRAAALADRLAAGLAELERLPLVGEVRRRGVMTGVELTDPRTGGSLDEAWRVGRRVILAARRRGVVVRPLGDVVVINPPLVMDGDEADLLLEALAAAIDEVFRGLPARATTAAGTGGRAAG